ncbi:MAG: hypothetical protein N2645_09410 [Clostridia bacterium]|nr:hypothetical protein [Clostridia bacterium]
MSDKSYERWKKWEKTIEKGKFNYCLWYGMIGWGLPVGFMLSLLDFYRTGGNMDTTAIIVFVVKMIVFMAGGIVYGLLTWKNINKGYQKYVLDRENRN